MDVNLRIFIMIIGASKAVVNVINGTPVRDIINGTAGNDIIIGFKDRDVLTGGSGADSLSCLSPIARGWQCLMGGLPPLDLRLCRNQVFKGV